jgi:hypothetical protein
MKPNLYTLKHFATTTDSSIYTNTMADPNPIAGGSGTGTGHIVQQQNIVIDQAAQNAAAQLAQQILTNTNFTLKQEIVKIPDYVCKLQPLPSWGG